MDLLFFQCLGTLEPTFKDRLERIPRSTFPSQAPLHLHKEAFAVKYTCIIISTTIHMLEFLDRCRQYLEFFVNVCSLLSGFIFSTLTAPCTIPSVLIAF